MKRKKVLIVINDMAAGGAETQALLLARGLLSREYPVVVLAFGQAKGLAWERFKAAGIEVCVTEFREKLLLPPFRSVLSYLRHIRYLLKLILLCRRIKPDVIFPFTYPPNIIMGRCWRFTGAHACWWNQRDEGRMFFGRPWEITSLNNCSGILSNSAEGKDFLKRFTNKPITIIHNGVEIPEKNSNPPASGKIRVVMVANLHGYKDHLTLLKAWSDVIRELGPGKATLILEADPDPRHQKLQLSYKRTVCKIQSVFRDRYLTSLHY